MSDLDRLDAALDQADDAYVAAQAAADAAKAALFDACAAAAAAGRSAEEIAEHLKARKTPAEAEAGYFFSVAYLRRQIRDRGVAPLRTGRKPSTKGTIMTSPSHQADERVTVRVMLTVGDDAELLTPEHDARNPLRIPAAVIAADAGLPANELPGRHFTAARAGDGFQDFRLLNDPRL